MTITSPRLQPSATLIAPPSAYTKTINSIQEYFKTTVASRLPKVVISNISLLSAYCLKHCEPEKRLVYMGLDASPFPHIKGVRINAIVESTAK